MRDDGDNVPFVGTTELVSGEIGEDFAAYFAYSEQLPTALAVGVKIGTDGNCLGAGGVFMQPLPGAGEESIRYVEETIGKFGAVSSMMQEHTAEEVWRAHFGEVQFYTQFPEYKCNCSRNYIEGVLAALGEKELRAAIAEQGKIEVHCHYCNTDYTFTPEDAEEIIRRMHKE